MRVILKKLNTSDLSSCWDLCLIFKIEGFRIQVIIRGIEVEIFIQKFNYFWFLTQWDRNMQEFFKCLENFFYKKPKNAST